MDVRALKMDIRRKIRTYGYAFVNGPVLRQTLRPEPATLDEAGRALTAGEAWVAEADLVGDRIVIRKEGDV